MAGEAIEAVRDLRLLRAHLGMRQRAVGRVNAAVKRGELTRPDVCSNCGNGVRSSWTSSRSFIEGHHENYDKPLEVVWLCKDCHEKQHETRHYKSAWNVADGACPCGDTACFDPNTCRSHAKG